MGMDLNRYTEKAQEALLQAQSIAGEYSHGQIEGEHLLLALLRQSEGIVPAIIQGMGLQPGMVVQQVEEELNRKGIWWGHAAQPVPRIAARTRPRDQDRW
jgi:ATP-dependent Clp protease ATP-binding subunit ClpB